MALSKGRKCLGFTKYTRSSIHCPNSKHWIMVISTSGIWQNKIDGWLFSYSAKILAHHGNP